MHHFENGEMTICSAPLTYSTTNKSLRHSSKEIYYNPKCSRLNLGELIKFFESTHFNYFFKFGRTEDRALSSALQKPLTNILEDLVLMFECTRSKRYKNDFKNYVSTENLVDHHGASTVNEIVSHFI